MSTLRIIGDVHGHYEQYVQVAKEAEYSIQVGDLGFEYDCLKQLDPNRHRVLAGNHDNYDRMDSGHWLGDYGAYNVPDFGNVFFVRGGHSIDRGKRLIGQTWWPQEEMSYGQLSEIIDVYKEAKPDFVISHECPASVTEIAFGMKTWDNEIIKPSRTSLLLQSLLEIHQPKHWVFGHHHRLYFGVHKTTGFICVPLLVSVNDGVKQLNQNGFVDIS